MCCGFGACLKAPCLPGSEAFNNPFLVRRCSPSKSASLSSTTYEQGFRFLPAKNVCFIASSLCGVHHMLCMYMSLEHTQVGDAEDRVAEVLRRAESERRDAKDDASSLKEQLETLRRGQQGGRGGYAELPTWYLVYIHIFIYFSTRRQPSTSSPACNFFLYFHVLRVDSMSRTFCSFI